jgi:hypothetical protein
MHIAQALFLLFLAADSVKVPTDPGVYYLNPKGLTRVEGRAVTVARSGSKLPRVPLRGSMPLGGGKVKAEILGEHAEQGVTSTAVFYYRVTEGGDAPSAGDLVLVKLKAKHGRREFELSAQSNWQASSGISLRSQVKFYENQVESGVYKLLPAQDLDPGEYGFYQYRGHDRPGFLYDFSVE